jgi:chromosome partitioning protein
MSPVRVSVFNNKGGVGKTTYTYHVAHCLAERGKTVLLVDCDSQCNLSAYSMTDTDIQNSWKDDGNSIYRAIEPVLRTLGDIRSRAPSRAVNSKGRLFIVPGDLRLSNFEDLLGDTWNGAKGGSEASLRAQSAIHRYIEVASEKVSADVVMIDLGPNLGALNRAVLASSDYFITPVAADLFSIQGTENLGDKLVTWNREWSQCHGAWKGDLSLPAGKPKYLGYVLQKQNIRSNSEGMTKGWQIYGNQIEAAVQSNIVSKLDPLDQVVHRDDEDFKLGQIPNLHSLIPYSLEARKPVFNCTSSDGLRGAHITSAAESRTHYAEIVETLLNVARDRP